MAINLSGASAAARAQQHRDRMFNRGILIAIALLLVAAAVYFFLRLHTETLRDDIQAQSGKIAQREAEISSQKTARVVDALFRIEDMRSHEVPRSVELDTLESITAHVTPDIRLTGYKYAYDAASGRKTITLDATTTEFIAIARQIEQLKKAALFDDVAVGDVDRDAQSGLLTFTLTMIKEVPVAVMPDAAFPGPGAPQM